MGLTQELAEWQALFRRVTGRLGREKALQAVRYGRFSLSFKRYKSLSERDQAIAGAQRRRVRVYAWPRALV